jgi:sugar O-acyltransferase (sialic acid O-acetyltransferase NeuD family)
VSRIKVAILGAGGFAREVWWALQDARAHGSAAQFETVMFVDRVAQPHLLKGLPVRTLADVPDDVLLICGVGGMTALKERIVSDAIAAGYRFTPAVVADGARVGPDVTIGNGTIICSGTTITTDVAIGAHVALNLDCTVGHDARIGDFATVSPGCHISGDVGVGRGAYLGTGAVVLEHLTIGTGSIIGAGAVVTSQIPDWSLAVGVPARIRKQLEPTIIQHCLTSRHQRP